MRSSVIKKGTWLASFMLAVCLCAHAEVKLPAIFSDGMVMQQQTKANLWGTATPNKKITVTTGWNGKQYVATADKNGAWKLSVSTPEAGGPYSITFNDGSKKTLNNILIGELWLCSGQSNMEMPMKGFKNQPVENANMDILRSKNPNIRLFTVKRTSTFTPQTDVVGTWKEATPETTIDCSAAAYFFARQLTESLHLPVGLVINSWGGSAIEAWIDEPTLKTVEGMDVEAAKDPKRGVHQRLECLYNSMLWPVKNFTAKGFLWYQGESNISNYQFYAPMMTAMVQLWRNVWEAPDMPFYYVQIAPYKYENSSNTGAALLREAQMEALKTIPNSGMIPTTDIGDEFCIHPSPKDVVGLRLATLALTKTYSIGRLPSNGPMMTKVDYEGNKAIVTFNNAPAGLFPTFAQLEGFEIAGADKKFYPAKAKIIGRTNTVEVSSEEVAQPVAVRYAFRNYVGNITLRNTFGLSAFPFRTDTWDDVK